MATKLLAVLLGLLLGAALGHRTIVAAPYPSAVVDCGMFNCEAQVDASQVVDLTQACWPELDTDWTFSIYCTPKG